MKRKPGSTMAFYAAFILFVGVPLMALTLDGSRLRAARTRLANAAEAGCAAYVNLVDADTWITGGRSQFAPNASSTASNVFFMSAPPGSTLIITPDVGSGLLMKAKCAATTTVHPFIGLGLGDYSISVSTDAKSEWVSGPFEH